ncbi:MAG: endonuclease III [Candidatus Hadarchaeales archaeon]
MLEILRRLESTLSAPSERSGNAFLTLVRTVLSQNTTSRNADLAFRRLVGRLTTPEELASADVREIARLIRPSGMYRIKSKNLRLMSRALLERYGGDLRRVLRMPYPDAKRELKSLPGVGQKTADVVLAFAGGRDVFPVDTHVFRLSRRLGFAGEKDGYEDVRRKLESVTPRGKRVMAHLLFIQLGRRICRARNPRHDECPVRDLCPSAPA